jgi:hypothetical protein
MIARSTPTNEFVSNVCRPRRRSRPVPETAIRTERRNGDGVIFSTIGPYVFLLLVKSNKRVEICLRSIPDSCT